MDVVSELETFIPQSSTRLGELFGRLDPAFEQVWRTHLGRLITRPGLDDRSRFLVLTAQYTVSKMPAQLEETVVAGIDAGVPPAEMLEVIFQCYVYTGPWVVAAGCEAFERALAQRPDAVSDLNERIADNATRSLDEERQRWGANDQSDPRIERLLETYGWWGFSTGLRLRPGHHINLVDTLDALDPDFGKAWLDSVYEGMYSRKVLSDRDRLLAVVGATLSIGETHQSRRHMRAALRAGATPKELLEVIIHTTSIFGHPHLMPAALDDLIRIADDEGTLDELVAPERQEQILKIVAARVARRGGIQDDINGAVNS
jgi:alkylhydroperoxidase/carboxymuconolactone decarboxylase family protein YurZ